VITLDSRGELLVDGLPACAKCQRRPRRPYPQKRGRVNKRKYYSYCGPCHAEYSRQRREGKVEMLLTPEEYEAVKAARLEPAGRHHARS
jgi:hypothetical protein